MTINIFVSNGKRNGKIVVVRFFFFFFFFFFVFFFFFFVGSLCNMPLNVRLYKKLIQYLECSLNHEYFGSLAK